MANIAIIGASGFTGIEVVKLLKKHPKIKMMDLFSFSNAGKKISTFSSDLKNYDDILKDFSSINYDNYDLIFFACPNGTAVNSFKNIEKSNAKIIDLAADFRLDEYNIWKEYYGISHDSADILPKITYGLTEINRELIKKQKIIANPGCYPTAAIIALLPLLKEDKIKLSNIIIDAKSGYSGAGREKIESGLKEEINNNFMPYNLDKHRHKPEIEQELNKLSGENTEIIFSPHIIPIYRGILETIYVDLKNNLSHEEIVKIYNKYYEKEKFINICSKGCATISHVAHTNNIQLSFHIRNNKKLTIISAIDNLIKGAAGQAVQNMNIMLGFEEDIALKDE
jgi:N-acetyl-gamma-glutamyl-phosphate reductase